jgi:predicted RNA-binding protein YlxR (DUF448 family)
VRLVRAGDGAVIVDAGGAPGRGAYVCAVPDCVRRALRPGRLAHALRASCRLGEELTSTVLAAAPLARRGQPLIVVRRR